MHKRLGIYTETRRAQRSRRKKERDKNSQNRRTSLSVGFYGPQ